MWAKVCANTNLEDALLAANLGADAVGFVFAPSSRQVTPDLVAGITSHLPPSVERIGVFDSHDSAAIVQAAREAGLTGIQLHGSLDLDLIQQIKNALGLGTIIIQTLHWDNDIPFPLETLQRQLHTLDSRPYVQRILIDSRIGTASGGTGITFDWAAASGLFHDELGDRQLIVAGGLRPENVGEAIRRLDPWGVDVATGVERFPGKKDPEKLKAFLGKALASN